jgi:hypothetical protein
VKNLTTLAQEVAKKINRAIAKISIRSSIAEARSPLTLLFLVIDRINLLWLIEI